MGNRVAERFQLLVGGLQLFVEAVQLIPGLGQFAVLLDSRFVRGEEEIDDLPPVGGNDVILPAEMERQASRRVLAFRPGPVRLHVPDAGQQVLLVIGLGDEVVGAAFQPPDHIPRVGERGQENDGNPAVPFVGLDPAAQLVAVHLRHDDVADDEGGLAHCDGGQRLPAVAGG